MTKLLFYGIGIASTIIAYYFYRSKDGMLRKIFIMYFLTEAFSMFFWGWEFNRLFLIEGVEPIIRQASIMCMIPVSITRFTFAYFIYKNYLKK